MRAARVHPEFVETIPSVLEDGVLYISIRYRTCQHKCCCGCGERVVTPLDPKFWRLTFNGQTVSLAPSIGNRDFNCKSHYFITNDRVRWSRPFGQYDEEDSEFASRSISAQSSVPKSVKKRLKGKIAKVKDVLLPKQTKPN